MSSFVLGFTSCGHNHEQSPVMKEVVEINVRLWEDLNSAKAEVRSRIEKVTTITDPLDSVREEKVSIELKLLMDQKLALESLDKIIPELKGYEPKCNHEPGEVHSHNTVDIEGLDEKELLEIHKELTSKLAAIKDNLKK
ncbi:MAG: hypothetical protein ACJAUX_000557 [Flavobacteriales bacterium]|jgi:hypothetical protein